MTKNYQKIINQIRSDLFPIFLILVVILFIYSISLPFEFVSDDIGGIVNNPSINKYAYMLSTALDPVHTFVNITTFKLFGLQPWAFRLVSILLHIANSSLLYFLVKFFLGKRIGLTSAIIFSIHPVVTEPVIWISAQAYLLMAFFFLLSVNFYVRSKDNLSRKFLSAVFYIFSIFSSEKAISLILIYPFITSRKKIIGNWNRWLPFVLIGVFYVIYFIFGKNVLTQRTVSLQTDFYASNGMYNPLLQIPSAISSYLEIFIWPKKLSFYWSEFSYSNLEYGIRLIITLLTVFYIIFMLYKNSAVKIFSLLFIISLLPYLTPFPIAWIVAERYAYLANMGLSAIFAYYFWSLSKNKYLSKILFPALIIILIGLATRTIIRIGDWRSADTLWLATGKTAPSDPKTHNNLGDYFGRRGNLVSAIKEFETAILLNPQYADAYHNLGNTYLQKGEMDKALEKFQKAKSINPNIWQTHASLASIYFEKGDYESAIVNIEEALKIQPDNPSIRTNYAVILIKSGKVDEAVNELNEIIKRYPENQPARQILESLKK